MPGGSGPAPARSGNTSPPSSHSSPLPTEPFETGRWFTPRVDRYAQVTVRMNKYSVPARMVGRQARVLLNASDLVVFDGGPRSPCHDGS